MNNAAGMDEIYGTYVDDECFDIHAYDDDTGHDTTRHHSRVRDKLHMDGQSFITIS